MDAHARGRVIPFAAGSGARTDVRVPQIDAATLSARFLASLDDLICRRPAGCRIADAWPAHPGAQLERVAIDIVDMLFGFVTDDPRLPRGVGEALLAAQLPVLQLAMREPEFFADWRHPARLLLNDAAPLAAAHAARGGDAAAFADAFARGLSAVLDDLAPNGAAFAIFHQCLREFVGSDTRPTPADARPRAEAAARAFLARPLPQIARDFLAGRWVDVLARVGAAHDDASPQWQDALAAIEELAWSLAPKHGEAERFRLIARMPPLLARLHRGLDLIGLSDEARRPFFTALAEAHSALLGAGGRPELAAFPNPRGPQAIPAAPENSAEPARDGRTPTDDATDKQTA